MACAPLAGSAGASAPPFWISSIEIENIALLHPDVANAAAIGIPHPKWDERPVLVIEPRAGNPVDLDTLRALLAGRIAKWWMPDDYLVVAAIPLGATGKVDKVALRRLVQERRERAAAVQTAVAHFAQRLEHYCRLAPYNWFNFYDFWDQGD